jgi:signal transduction histidine kinase/CheY-like chemotaxis protein
LPNIDVQTASLARRPPGLLLPAATLGDASAVLGAVFSGKLRRQLYSDVFHFSDASDAPRQVATGYICLAGALGWTLGGLNVLWLNPTAYGVIALAVVNAVACFVGFLQLRWKRDPRPILDWLVISSLVSIMPVAFVNGGIVAPAAFSIPVLVGISAAYQRPRMWALTFAVGAATIATCMLAALGVIGDPTTYTHENYVIRVFVVLIATTMGLGAVAWLSGASRDYLLDQTTIANAAIVDSAARARVALEAARVGLWDVPNAEQNHFEVSESFQAVTGYSGPEFSAVLTEVERFIHADDVQSLRDAFAAGRAQGTRIRLDFRLLTKSRGYRWFSTRARYSENPDGTMRISGSLQDINFIKVAEEALRTGRDQARAANKAKSDFIAVMGHEVRTPLNAILGSVELLKRGLDERESHEMLSLIDEAGRGLLAIVNDLLDVSRIDAGKLEITTTPTDLIALVRRTLDFWGPQASDKGIALSIEVSSAHVAPVMVDAGRVRQIVGNLLSNAIKFTDEGSVRLMVSTENREDGRIGVTLSVIDTGAGVPEAAAAGIFTAFEQAPGSASLGGAGLGLFISRRLARMMGGDLTLEPSTGSGAHFRLVLTLDLADALSSEARRIDSTPTEWDGLHVLCVDDNDKNRRIAELLLGQLGFAVTLAASGAEALDVCAIQRFDFILMDIVMPGLDGPQTLQAIRSDADGLNRATPCIALTAKLAREDLEAYRGAGFEGVSGKPVDVGALTREIARVLAIRRPAIRG